MPNTSITSKIYPSILILLFLTSNVMISQGNIEESTDATSIRGNPVITSNGDYFDAYNLFIIERRSMVDYTSVDKTLYLTDMGGNIIIEKDIGLDGFMSVEFLNSTTLLYGNYFGAFLWNIETDETEQLGFKGHHDYERNEANDTYFTLHPYIIENQGTEYLYDQIAEHTHDGSLVWSVNMSDFIPFSHWCPFQDLEIGGVADVTHANSINYDPDQDVIYVNCRNTNTFYKIDHKTGSLLWSLGEHGNFTMRDIYGNIKDILFYHGHALEIISENSFIYFDNDEHNQTDNLNHHSRIIEITIDENTMTANTTYEFLSPKDYHTAWWGDADLLPNGNKLGTFGTHGHEGNTTIGARLVEVNSKSEIVWEMYFPKEGDIAGGVYRMERISLSPIIQIDPLYWIKSGEKAIINWEAFYNFRNKYPMNGSYRLYFEEELIEQSELDFKKYWQPTSLSADLGYLEDGNYNLTIVIKDESGHQNIKQINLQISENPPETVSKSRFQPLYLVISLFLVSVINLRRKKLNLAIRYA